MDCSSMGQGHEDGELLGPHLTHGRAPLPLISVTPFFSCIAEKHQSPGALSLPSLLVFH